MFVHGSQSCTSSMGRAPKLSLDNRALRVEFSLSRQKVIPSGKPAYLGANLVRGVLKLTFHRLRVLPHGSCARASILPFSCRGVLKLAASVCVALSFVSQPKLPLRGSRQQSPRLAPTLSCVSASGA